MLGKEMGSEDVMVKEVDDADEQVVVGEKGEDRVVEIALDAVENVHVVVPPPTRIIVISSE